MCVLWYLRVSIQPYYLGIDYGVGVGMQAVLANKLPLHPSDPVTRPVPASTRGRIICPELQVRVIYVATLLTGTHKEEEEMTGGEVISFIWQERLYSEGKMMKGHMGLTYGAFTRQKSLLHETNITRSTAIASTQQHIRQ